jgi:antitoxin Phd
MNNNIWQLQEAKSKFSAVIERALAHGAQVVTRRGKKTVVVLSYEEYEQLTRQGSSLVQFLLSSPLANSELSFERKPETPRDVEIEK